MIKRNRSGKHRKGTDGDKHAKRKTASAPEQKSRRMDAIARQAGKGHDISDALADISGE
jgi:hypothetical protein